MNPHSFRQRFIESASERCATYASEFWDNCANSKIASRFDLLDRNRQGIAFHRPFDKDWTGYWIHVGQREHFTWRSVVSGNPVAKSIQSFYHEGFTGDHSGDRFAVRANNVASLGVVLPGYTLHYSTSVSYQMGRIIQTSTGFFVYSLSNVRVLMSYLLS